MAEAIKIGIIGAGAVGGVMAAMLAEAGYDVELARRYQSQINLGNHVALEVSGEFGRHTILVPSVAGAGSFRSKKDIIFVLTKAYDTISCIKESLPFLTERGVFVCTQNVMNIDELSKVVNLDKIVGLVIDWMSVRHNAGVMEVIKRGGMQIGAFGHVDYRLMDALQQMLSSITPTAVTDNILGLAYSRMVMNACVSSLGALTGLSLGRWLALKHAEQICYNIIKEGIDIANALQVKVEPYDAVIDYDKFVENDCSAKIYRNKLLARMRKNNLYTTSSCLMALERKQKTEVEYLNGYLIRVANKINYPVAVNDRLYVMIKEIEDGKRNCNSENIQDFDLNHPKKYLEKKKKKVN